MPSNVEIKARIADPTRLRAAVEDSSDTPPQVLVHEDTFFNVSSGCLKLRTFGDGRGELIFYQRPDTAGPKPCLYSIAPVADPMALKAVLSQALGIRAVVRKRRTLYMLGQTRIHLDEVDGLGDFLELEVVLRDAQTAAEGTRIVEDLLVRLGIPRDALIDCAYVDLLERATGENVAARPPQGTSL